MTRPYNRPTNARRAEIEAFVKEHFVRRGVCDDEFAEIATSTLGYKVTQGNIQHARQRLQISGFVRRAQQKKAQANTAAVAPRLEIPPADAALIGVAAALDAWFAKSIKSMSDNRSDATRAMSTRIDDAIARITRIAARLTALERDLGIERPEQA